MKGFWCTVATTSYGRAELAGSRTLLVTLLGHPLQELHLDGEVPR